MANTITTLNTTARIVGVVLIDLTTHVHRNFLCTSRPETTTPIDGWPAGTNVEVHIGDTRHVSDIDPTLHEIAQAARGCSIVVKGSEVDGVQAVVRTLQRMTATSPRPSLAVTTAMRTRI